MPKVFKLRSKYGNGDMLMGLGFPVVSSSAYPNKKVTASVAHAIKTISLPIQPANKPF